MSYLTLQYSENKQKELEFTSLEAYPLTSVELETLNYGSYFKNSPIVSFKKFSNLPWEKTQEVSQNFKLLKKAIKFENFLIDEVYDVIFYDAFGFHAQPELWSYNCMKKCNDLMAPSGVWVSYCAKGGVRRDLETIGFEVSRLPGPPGKREMLRAIKV